MGSEALIWSYRYEVVNPHTYPRTKETFETVYEGHPVVVEISTRFLDMPPRKKLLLKVFTSNLPKRSARFKGLEVRVNDPRFTQFVKSRSSEIVPVKNPPNLEQFITNYRPIFESQKDLRDTYSAYL